MDDEYRSFAVRIHAMSSYFARLNLIRFHGVLATHAKLQADIILGGQKTKSKPSNVNDDLPQLLASVRISWACL